MSELRLIVSENAPDIIAVSEIKPKNFERVRTAAEYKIDNYDMEFENVFIKDSSRGLMVYIHESIKFNRIDLKKILGNSEIPQEILACEVKLTGNDKMLFCAVYRCGSCSEYNNVVMNNAIQKLSTANFSHVCIVGDFNYPKIDWNSWSSGSSSMDDGYKFIECIRDSFLFQHVSTPTRGRGSDKPSCIDLVLTNEELMIENLDIGAPLGRSDHAMISFDFICKTEECPPKILFQYEKADYKKMFDMLNVEWENLFSSHKDDVNKQWEIFVDLYKRAEKECIPQKIIRTGNKKFRVPLDKKTLAKKKRKYRLWKRFVETEDGQVHTEYRRCSNQLRNLTRKATKIFEKNLSKNVKTHPKKFWKYVNHKTSVKTSIPDLYTSEDEDPNNMATSDKEKANRLAEFFSGVMTRELDDVWTLANKPEIKFNLEIDISEEIILKKLTKLKISKSPGPDGIHPRVLKELKLVIARALTIIFRTSLRTGKLPEA